MLKSRRLFFLMLALALCLTGCMIDTPAQGADGANPTEAAVKPAIPEKLEKGEDGVPILDVYDVSQDQVERTNLEDYVLGVVAGEMKNDWPMEALKAQAILARTFVLKFCDTKQSRYSGADISTDVSEAQAYAPDSINDRVRQAVEETRGEVMSADGEYPYAWFSAHAGGKTELPSVALDYHGKDPEYLRVTDSPESEKAPENVKNWKAVFTKDEVKAACADAGVKIDSVDDVEFGERGQSGRVKNLIISGETVSAPSFRIAIGANRLKSTLIRSAKVQGDEVIFEGSGFGHGVGMSQWGAYALAEEGQSAEEIVEHYFQDVDIVKLW